MRKTTEEDNPAGPKPSHNRMLEKHGVPAQRLEDSGAEDNTPPQGKPRPGELTESRQEPMPPKGPEKQGGGP